MRVHEKALRQIVALAVADKGEEAKRHVGFILPRGADLTTLREQLADWCAPQFLRPVMAALPWLANDKFDVSPIEDPFISLTAAGGGGRPLRELEGVDLEALGAVIFDAPTGGRPRKMVRLKAFDPQYNVWAKQ